jgi:dephospho-CoA kinase
MKRIGITGGYASGKSVVSAFFEQAGYPVLHADPLAKELMVSNPGVKAEIERIVGKQAYGKDGRLDTAFVAGQIFSDQNIKGKVEAVVHPAVIRSIESKLDTLERLDKSHIAFVEAALIYESRIDSMFDYIIAVYAPLGVRMERGIKRDGLSESEVHRRIASQYPQEYIAERADFVIENAGSLDQLNTRLTFILRLLETLSQDEKNEE